MNVPAYIRRCVASWRAWRTTQRLYRAMPELREIDRRAAKARLGHKPVRKIVAERQRAIHAELAREVGRHV